MSNISVKVKSTRNSLAESLEEDRLIAEDRIGYDYMKSFSESAADESSKSTAADIDNSENGQLRPSCAANMAATLVFDKNRLQEGFDHTDQILVKPEC